MIKKITLLGLGFFFLAGQLSAQTIDASPETQTICAGGNATLTAVVTPGGGGGSLPTNSYAISAIPYSPDPFGGGTAVALPDDGETPALPIGFTFCFFGNNYTNFYLGSNNYIAFTGGTAFGTWVPQAIPSATFTRNAIMGPWQDINPAAGGTVTYATYGVAPFRRLSVSWNNVPMFSCTGQIYSSQIIIYETTNIIETHILNKSICLGWQSGHATHGIQNATGTVAFVAPGRNNTTWSVSNEGMRWTPNGTPNYQINWYILPANTLIGTGSPITVTPPTSPQYYYAEVVDLNACPSGVANNTDTVEVLSQTPAVDAGAFTTICPGNSTTLSGTAPTATTFSWSPAGSLSNPAISNPVASPGASTTYTLTVTDGLGCNGSDTVTVALAPMSASAGSAAAICIGQSTTLNASGGTSYSWSPAATLSNPFIANPVATPTTTTNYTVTATQGVCTATSVVTVTVNPLPAVDAGANQAICVGTLASLNGSGATSYAWSPSFSLSNASIANPLSNTSTTQTYTLVGTDGNGCVANDSVTITVNPLPVVDAGAFVSICPGTSTTLGASGASNYTWTPAASLSNANIANPIATPSSTTTYSVTGTDGNGCTATDLVTVTVTPINVTITPGSPAVCNGSSTTLTANGAATYSWSPGGTLSSSTIANPVATPTTTTAYTVIGTSGLGCADTATFTLFVFPLPPVNASPNTSMCSGSTSTLTVTGATGYVWTPSATLSSSTGSSVISSATTTTTYTVTGTDGNGCTNTDVVTVTINASPTVDAGASVSICPGSSTTLNATGAVNYLWSPGATLSSTTIANPVATPSSATTYTVVGTSAAGCTATDVVTISVAGIAVSATSASPSVCLGSSTTLTGTGGTSYTWSPAATLSSSTIANPVATPTATTTYTVIGTAGAGCADTAFVTVTVDPLPTVSAGSAASMCSGATIGLSASGASSYVWTPAGSLTGSTTATPTSSATTTTTYTVTGTSAAGCTATSTVTLTVDPLPTASAGPAASVCTGGSTTLAASGGTTYSWAPAATLSSSTISNPVATPAVTTTYTVTVTNASGCSATSTVTVTVNAIPTATATGTATICNGASTNLTAGGGTTYSWSPAGTLSSSTTATPTATPGSTTTYTVTVSTGACSSTATVTVTVNNTMSMASPTSNPATCGNADGDLTAGAVTGGGSPYTYSVNGGPGQSSTNFTGLTSGTYTVTVTDNAGCTASSTVTVTSVLGVNAAFSASPSSGSSPLTVDLTNTSNGASAYIWDFDNGGGSILTNPSTVYNANGTYTITLIAYNGSLACSDTTTLTIEVFDAAAMIVPNVFTPNGDLDNDVFVPITNGMKTVSGTIYNRWGTKIAEWSGAPTLGWDGTHNGKKSEDGTYYYIIKATGFDDKEYDASGYVQLLGTK